MKALASVVVIGLLAGCASPVSISDAPLPSEIHGAAVAWAYETRARQDVEFLQEGERGFGSREWHPRTVVQRIIPMRDLPGATVAGVEHSPTTLRQLNGFDGKAEESVQQLPAERFLLAYRNRDLYPVRVNLVDCETRPQCGAMSRPEFPKEFSYLPSPLVMGSAWQGRLPFAGFFDEDDFESAGGNPFTWRVEATVGETRNFTVETTPIPVTEVSFEYQLEGEELARERIAKDYERRGGRLDAYTFHAHRREVVQVSEDLGVVVSRSDRTWLNGTLRGSAPAETPQDEAIRFVGETTRRLVGFSKEAPIGLSRPNVNAILRFERPLVESPLLPTRLVVRATASTANAAEAQILTFWAETPGGAPSSRDVTWRLEDSLSRTVASGEGPTTSWTFSQPGLYRFVAATNDGEAVGAYAVAANYARNVSADCPTVGVPPLSCRRITFPISVGLQTLTVYAKPAGAGSAVPAELYLSDSRGNVLRASADANGAARMRLETFEPLVNEGQLWELQLFLEAPSPQSYSYGISATYEATIDRWGFP